MQLIVQSMQPFAVLRKKFCDERLPDGSLMEITKVYPLDAVFDTLDDVPEDVSMMLVV